MGVADRMYMRRGGPPPIAAGSSWTLRFFVMLVVVYIVSVAGERSSWWPEPSQLELSWSGFSRGRVWTIVTSALLHDTRGYWHIAFNLLGLWYFGKLVEETLGGPRYVAFFWLAAVVSHVPFLVSEIVTGDATSTIGASGIVVAMLVFAAFRYPGMPWNFWGIPLRLWQLAALYVVIDVLGALHGGGFVDHWTHLGGAAFGGLVHKYGLFPRVKAPILPHGGRPPREPGPLQNDDARREIDRILDKINAQGVGALTESEKAFLKENSGRYR